MNKFYGLLPWKKKPKDCNECKKPITLNPIRVCWKCLKPVGVADKWHLVTLGELGYYKLEHRHCDNPEAYLPRGGVVNNG